jgi:hypothetical protein
MDVGFDEKVILKEILKTRMRAVSGFTWLRIGTSYELSDGEIHFQIS